MFCTYCQDHPPPKTRGVSVWMDVPCTTIIKHSLVRHETSQGHTEAKARFDSAKAAERTGGIAQAMKKQVNLERSAFLAALRAMYWLTTNEIPHTTNFSSLLDMMRGLGLSYLSHLNKVL